jgi:hypothetical protein
MQALLEHQQQHVKAHNELLIAWLGNHIPQHAGSITGSCQHNTTQAPKTQLAA